MMRSLPVILLSTFMIVYGHPAGPGVPTSADLQSSSVQGDYSFLNDKRIDWKSLNTKGGYAYITEYPDPKTGTKDTKVYMSTSPWTGSNGPRQLSDIELTKEEQDKYDWLVANLKPPTPAASDSQQPVDKKDSMELTKEEQDKYDWLVANLEPVTPGKDDIIQPSDANDRDSQSVNYNSVQPSAAPLNSRPSFPLGTKGIDTKANADIKSPGSGNWQQNGFKWPSQSTPVQPSNGFVKGSDTTSFTTTDAKPIRLNTDWLNRFKPFENDLRPPTSYTYNQGQSSSPIESEDDVYPSTTTTTTNNNEDDYYYNRPIKPSTPVVDTGVQPTRYNNRLDQTSTFPSSSVGKVYSPQKATKQFEPYTVKDENTLVLTKDNVDRIFPEDKLISQMKQISTQNNL